MLVEGWAAMIVDQANDLLTFKILHILRVYTPPNDTFLLTTNSKVTTIMSSSNATTQIHPSSSRHHHATSLRFPILLGLVVLLVLVAPVTSMNPVMMAHMCRQQCERHYWACVSMAARESSHQTTLGRLPRKSICIKRSWMRLGVMRCIARL